jgi:flagellar basal-body rod protein FlgC
MSLFSSLTVSASGMSAQRLRAELLVENIANADTTRTSEGGPYKRKDVLFEAQDVGSAFADLLSGQLNESTGVAVSGIVYDQRPPERRYMPGHPDAGPDGYVSFPGISQAEEMVDMMDASRGYQANVASMTAVKEMIQRSIDLLK